MAKPSPESSDDLFDRLVRGEEKSPVEEIWSVSRLSTQIRRLVEDGLPVLWVEGEISNFKLHSSGHRYFTLKDDSAQISCVMWRTRVPPVGVLQDGIKVRVYGRVTVWEQAGKYQFDVQNIMLAGVGSLQAAFELLKQKLAAEGLFDESRKKRLPKFPNRIGIVTSPTGAVIHDLAWGFATRFPPAKITLIPVAVQGDGAGRQIAAAIETFNRLHYCDVIIVGRGGGSLEDLWPFNEEVVVRAIANSTIPIVSAVGHEVDFTLADLAADLRAPTPTGAAALVVPDRKELFEALSQKKQAFGRQLEKIVALWKLRIDKVVHGYGFKRLPNRIGDERLRLDELSRRMQSSIERNFETRRLALASVTSRYAALSPKAVLNRGYGIARHSDGSLVRNGADLSIGESIELTLAKGGAGVKVERTWSE